ncbi:general substrate transporter [Xylogone sp. PMI_703]|nr:general substrate transporter [Xylogone sp. PMI_703]
MISSIKNSAAIVWKSFNRTLLLSCCLIAVSQFNFGFDQTAFSTTQAMDAFEKKFGVYNSKSKTYSIQPYFLSLLNSLPYAGFAIGLIVGSMISARYGRRMAMFVMSLYAICTAVIVITSNSRAQILTARLLNYGYVGMELSVVPIFQAEIVPREVRGLVVGTYQLMLNLGGLIMSIICQATSSLEGDKQWRIPFGLFLVIPSFVASAIWFIPESPRWLLLNERGEESLDSLTKLRRGRFNTEQIQSEYEELRISLELEVQQGKYSELFKNPDSKRTWITVGTNFFLQITGQVFTAKYGTVYIKSLGTVDPFTMTVINQVINTVAVIVAMTLLDRLGRRPLLMFGGTIQAVALFAMGGLGTPSTITRSMKLGVVSLLSVFNFGFYVGWAPTSHVISSEIPTLRLRDKTYRVASVINILIQFVTTFSIPYLLDAPYANLGSKVGFVFGATTICALVFGYLCVPECKGRTLEEIDKLFLEGYPVGKFKTAQVGLTSEEKDEKVVVHVEETKEVV